ncbi:MAG: 3-phosphoserine/phosphohydroxythreonine transaminase, partial [Pantoea sp. Brub]|nr:3-phosphoserine/phosphohydroxythreonine transaminase [Pantoea sp. Brub]
SAGPSMLPIEVMCNIKKELTNWSNLGISVMEISHRSKEFIFLVTQIQNNLRKLLNIPLHYKILFCYGGARGQFSAIPGNLMKSPYLVADYIDGGYWSHAAIQEAKKYCVPNILKIKTNVNNMKAIIPMKNWNISENSQYLHFCANETIDGIAINEEPCFDNKIVIADLSSTFLSHPININSYSIIYASSQKNIGIAGFTVLIIREDLLNIHGNSFIPSILNYKILFDNNSMFNTPPTFSWYISGLVFDWLKNQGGLIAIDKINKIKSDFLYNFIDKSDFYYNNIEKNNRSKMNVTFKLTNNNLENLFLQESKKIGLLALNGHRSVGGLRASIYNAMPIKGVKKLIDFMKYFEYRYG